MKLIIATAVAFAVHILGSPAASTQDAQGNDTAGSWVVDYFEPFGIWKSSCDHRVLSNIREDRCYLRYVEVFSPRPKFGAVFLFVFQKDRKTAFQYGIERGTKFAENGLRVSRSGGTSYAVPQGCRVGSGCILDGGQEVEELLREMSNGETLVQSFVDRHGNPQQLKWPLEGFKEALADYRLRSKKLDLIDE